MSLREASSFNSNILCEGIFADSCLKDIALLFATICYKFQYKSKYLSIPEKKLNSFNGSLVDIGIALNFTEGDNKFNLNTGPMLRDQAKQLFSEERLLPEVGIFSDTDFFNENPSQLGSYKQKDLLELAKQGTDKAEAVQNIVAEIINSKKDK